MCTKKNEEKTGENEEKDQKRDRIHGICCSQQAKKITGYHPTDGLTLRPTETCSYRVTLSGLKNEDKTEKMQKIRREENPVKKNKQNENMRQNVGKKGIHEAMPQ